MRMNSGALMLIGAVGLLTLTACQPSVSGLSGRNDLSGPSEVDSPRADSFSESMYQFALARLVGMDGDLAGAAEALEKAISEDPGSAYLKVTLAEVYLHLDKLEESFRLAEDALILDPDLLQGHLLLANLHARRSSYGEAVHYLEQAADLEPDDERILFQLSLYHGRNGDMDKSIAVLKGLAERFPEESHIRLALARAYRQTGLDRLGEEAYRSILAFEPESYLAITELAELLAATGREEDSERLLQKKVHEFPRNNRLRHRLVGVYIDQGRFHDALEHLERILDLDPVDQSALRRAGLILFDQKEWDTAGQYFERLLAIDQEDDQALYYSGIAREETGAWEAALSLFSAVDAASGLYADSLIHQAYNLNRLKQTGDAIALLEKNRALLSSRPEIFDYLSYLYRDLEKPGQALAVIDEGLQKFPADETLLYRKVVLLDKEGQKEQADQVALLLLKNNPGHVNAMNFLAYSYAVQNTRLETALDLATQALAARDTSYIRDTLGWVLYRLGRYDEALEHLLAAAAKETDDPVIYEHLGFVYKALGKADEARWAFEKSLHGSKEAKPEIQQEIDALRQVTE